MMFVHVRHMGVRLAYHYGLLCFERRLREQHAGLKINMVWHVKPCSTVEVCSSISQKLPL
jgi:hypothetical protein